MEIKRKDGTTRRFHMPSRAHLMSKRQDVMAGDVLAKIRAKPQDKTSRAVCRAWSSCSSAQARDPAS